MKLLFSYTFDYIKRNWCNSMAIMVAILMTSTMLSALCGFLYNVYADNLSLVLRQSGNWHGELFDNTPGSKLPIIENFDSLEAVLIKGDWKTAQIDDPRRKYLVWRDANAAYWASMPEGNIAILEGHAPVQTGEIALSKQYFEHHPELTMGDTITLPMGDRIDADGAAIPPQSITRQGERFVKTGEISVTVVGKLDVTTSGTVPAYIALGFLDPVAILPDDDLTCYFRFHNIRDTYRELDKIAAAVGYEKDEYGNYMLRYNTDYLTRMGVLSPEQTGLLPKLMTAQMPLTFAVIGLLTAALFVLIIHNAFALSFSARLSQLGIFASVGATPRQIKRSVILEALLLTATPLPLGLVLGQIIVWLFIHYANSTIVSANSEPMAFVLGWQAVLPAILLTLLTVWWSALIPARKIAQMSPITAIRQGGAEKLKKPRRLSFARLGGLFGLPGELAATALQARKKSYRTATVSLVLSFLVLACMLCINSASTASRAVYQSEEKRWAKQDILFTLHNVPTDEDFTAVSEQVVGLKTIESARWYNTLRVAAWVPEDAFSAEFEEKGGFAAVEEYLSDAQVPLLRDGERRVRITLLGLDDATFAAYCDTLQINPAPFYQTDRWRSILYHTVDDVVTGTKRSPVQIPFFDIYEGDTMPLTEQYTDDYPGDFTFEMEVTAIADRMPPVGGANFGVRYSAVQVMPMRQVQELSNHFVRPVPPRVSGVLQVFEPAQIASTRTEIERIGESYFGSGDYDLTDENESFANDAIGAKLISMIFGFVAGLLAVIGLSNAWSTVRGTLNARRREFAMLRSVGLPPRGLRRMLTLEAAMLGLTPILLGSPVVIVLQAVFLWINEVTLLEWLPFAPWLPLIVYISAVLGVTVAAYIIGGRKLLDENIIEAIKVDSI